jgi:hypothetical protein
MKETIAQFLKVKDFPFIIKDKNGKEIYYENSNGFWSKREFDSDGKEIYAENSNGFWIKREYNSDGNEIYYEDSNGFWSKTEYNSDGKEIYAENSNGFIIDNRPKAVVEMTLQEVADKLGMDVSQIRIKD